MVEVTLNTALAVALLPIGAFCTSCEAGLTGHAHSVGEEVWRTLAEALVVEKVVEGLALSALVC